MQFKLARFLLLSILLKKRPQSSHEAILEGGIPRSGLTYLHHLSRRPYQLAKCILTYPGIVQATVVN